jgi:hypothetical protein
MELMARLSSHGRPSAGLIGGPLAWGISTQLNYALSPWLCDTSVPVVELIATVLVILSLAGALLSWRALRHLRDGPGIDAPTSYAPHRMIALVGVAAGLLFALIIAMQGTAALFLDGCR